MKRFRYLLFIFVLILASPSTALAQPGTFDSGSNGSDGALTITTPGTYIFNPRAFNPPLDPDGDNIYHFTTINIGAGVTVTLSGNVLNGPVYWLASGTVNINGFIDLNGDDGQGQPNVQFIYPNNGIRSPASPGAGGYPGGIGTYNPLGSLSQSGMGPGGGLPANNSNRAGGESAGHLTFGLCNSTEGLPYGNNYLVPLIGGSGGGGGYGRYDQFYQDGGGGGGGGGAILIASSVSISLNGTIQANAGRGGSSIGPGGIGSGGSIRLSSPRIEGNGAIEAQGGGGCNGSPGRIRLEAFEQKFLGAIQGGLTLASPYELYLPTTPPSSVKVVKIDNAQVKAIPTNQFTTPDATINSSGVSTITIEARYVPLGSRLTLVLIPENATDQELTSTPLVGTLELSTATVTATIPSGYSRMYVYSKWAQ